MKKTFTLLLLVLMVQVGFTQEQEEKKERNDAQTIFSDKNLKFSGGFIAPEIKVGNIYDDNGVFIGGRMGAIFNDRFSVGLGGYGLTAKSSFNYDFDVNGPEPLRNVRIGMGYGGLAFEYAFFSQKAVHFTIPVLVGAGGFVFYEGTEDFWDEFNEFESTAAFFLVPGVNLELNLFKHLRFNVGASYRLVQGTSLDENGLGRVVSDEDLSDFLFNASLKFGFF